MKQNWCECSVVQISHPCFISHEWIFISQWSILAFADIYGSIYLCVLSCSLWISQIFLLMSLRKKVPAVSVWTEYTFLQAPTQCVNAINVDNCTAECWHCAKYLLGKRHKFKISEQKNSLRTQKRWNRRNPQIRERCAFVRPICYYFLINGQLGIKSILLYKLCRFIFICDSIERPIRLIRVDLGQMQTFLKPLMKVVCTTVKCFVSVHLGNNFMNVSFCTLNTFSYELTVLPQATSYFWQKKKRFLSDFFFLMNPQTPQSNSQT